MQVPNTMSNGKPWPRITIVTPSYNQGRFIEATIRSVLLQGYPNLEYIIMDAASTDDSVEIIKRYQDHLAYWQSKPDRGQAHAINQGFTMASGEWFNWLNSDDMLMPGALITLAEITGLLGDPAWITGTSLFISEAGAFLDFYSPWRTDPCVIGLDIPSFPQDATFVRADFLRRSGVKLREDLSNVFDTIFHQELFQIAQPIVTTAIFSGMRLHPQQKTANVAQLTKETHDAVAPLLRNYPLLKRLILRLLQTRFRQAVNVPLKWLVLYGLTSSSRRWQAVTFNRENFRWHLVPARELIT